MVSFPAAVCGPVVWGAVGGLLAQGQNAPALERMSPQQRVKVLAAFAAFMILLFGMIALIWLGARVTRRYMNQEPLRPLDPLERADDWATKPLHRPERPDDDGE